MSACRACGAEMVRATRGRPRVFCSSSCAKEFWNAARRKPSMERVCEVCDATFSTARADQRFCGWDCGHKFHRRLHDRAWTERSEESKEAERRRKAQHPGRAAHAAVQRAVAAGELVRESCVVCGDPRSHGHHEDYARPLEVTWLCARHHAEVHANVDA